MKGSDILSNGDWSKWELLTHNGLQNQTSNAGDIQLQAGGIYGQKPVDLGWSGFKVPCWAYTRWCETELVVPCWQAGPHLQCTDARMAGINTPLCHCFLPGGFLMQWKRWRSERLNGVKNNWDHHKPLAGWSWEEKKGEAKGKTYMVSPHWKYGGGWYIHINIYIYISQDYIDAMFIGSVGSYNTLTFLLAGGGTWTRHLLVKGDGQSKIWLPSEKWSTKLFTSLWIQPEIFCSNWNSMHKASIYSLLKKLNLISKPFWNCMPNLKWNRLNENSSMIRPYKCSRLIFL